MRCYNFVPLFLQIIHPDLLQADNAFTSSSAKTSPPEMIVCSKISVVTFQVFEISYKLSVTSYFYRFFLIKLSDNFHIDQVEAMINHLIDYYNNLITG